MNQRIGTLFLICGCVFPVSAQAAEEDVRIAATKKASAYLLETGQAEDGSFSAQVGPAITGLVITSLIKTYDLNRTHVKIPKLTLQLRSNSILDKTT